MKRIRIILAVLAVAVLVAALDMAMLSKTVFLWPVMALLGASAVCAVGWAAVTLGSMADGAGKHRALGRLNAAIATVLFFFICVAVYAFSTRWDREWDLTREGRRDLAPQTVQVLENLDRDVKVTAFFVLTGDSLTDAVREKTRRFLDRAQRYSGRLSVEFIDPQRHPERLEALGVARTSAVGTVVITAGARQREIPLSDVTSRLEERDFTNSLINVVRDAEPTICFLTGHGEHRVIDADPKKGLNRLRAWLEKESYTVQEIGIALTRPEVPGDCDVLVIAAPTMDLFPQEIQAIQAYIERGGRLLALLDPSYILPGQAHASEQFRPWLESHLGVLVGGDAVVSPETKSLEVLLVTDFGLVGADASVDTPEDGFRGSFNQEHSITRGADEQIVFSAVRSVQLARELPDGLVGWTLLRTAPGTWAEKDLQLLYESSRAVEDDDEQGGPVGVAAAVSKPSSEGAGGRDARVVVVGDGDFCTNDKIAYAGNQNLLLNAMAWLTEREDLIAIRPTGEEGQPVKLSVQQQQSVAWIASLAPLHVIILAGAAMYLWRRKHA